MRRQQRLGLAEAALAAHPLRIGGDLADGFDIGGEPGEAVDRVLLGFDARGVEPALRG